MFQSNLELVSNFFYPHEKRAFQKWYVNLERGCSKREAIVYYEACSVLLETLRRRLERYTREGNY